MPHHAAHGGLCGRMELEPGPAPSTRWRSRFTLCGARLGHERAREGRGTRTSTRDRDRDTGPLGWRGGALGQASWASPGSGGSPRGPRDPQED